jgi:hypothetical protein
MGVGASSEREQPKRLEVRSARQVRGKPRRLPRPRMALREGLLAPEKPRQDPSGNAPPFARPCQALPPVRWASSANRAHVQEVSLIAVARLEGAWR